MATINNSDEEQPADPQPQPDQPPNEAGGEQQGEAGTKQQRDVRLEQQAGVGGDRNTATGVVE